MPIVSPQNQLQHPAFEIALIQQMQSLTSLIEKFKNLQSNPNDAISFYQEEVQELLQKYQASEQPTQRYQSLILLQNTLICLETC